MPQSRLDDMNEHGVDVQVLYPTYTGQMLGREFRDTKLLAACVRAYNNWATDYTSLAPQRLRWAAALPMQDVEEAITEAHRAAEAGCVSYYMRPQSGPWPDPVARGLPSAVGRDREDRQTDLDPRFGLGLGAVVRRPDGHPYQRPYSVAPV